MKTDERALHEMVYQLESAWNAGDGDAFAALFAEDADVIHILGGYYSGRETIRAGHRMIFGTIYKGSNIRYSVEKIKFLRPDIAIVRGNPRVYAKHHPMPEDISLLIEISDTTLYKDRKQKLPSYARSGIPVYWIVNVFEHQVELYTKPVADQYGSKLVFSAGQSVPVVIDGVEVGQIAVDDFMPEIEPAAGGGA